MSGAAVERDLLLALLDQAFDRPSWHGTNLRGSLRRLDPAQATWRPGTGWHNVWELIVHCAYWKYAVWRRFEGAGRGSFSLRGSNWFARPAGEATAAALRADVVLLEEWHAKLRAAVAAAPAAVFAEPAGKGRFTVREWVTGISAHDLYHAGQVQLLKRLAAPAARRGG